MEPSPVSVRVSGRKAKRKVFNDYVSTDTWTNKPKKRQSMENGETSAKSAKLDGSVALQKEDISIEPEAVATSAVSVTAPSTTEGSAEYDVNNPTPTQVSNTLHSSEEPQNSSNDCHGNTSTVAGNGSGTTPINAMSEEAEKPIKKIGRLKNTRKVSRNTRNVVSSINGDKPHRGFLSGKRRIGKQLKRNNNSEQKVPVHSQRQIMEQSAEETEAMAKKHSCKKSGCGKVGLTCCIKATNQCMEASGKSSRWYHMSLEEHYCNGCFEQFYRIKNSGCDDFHEWKRAWMQNSKADGSFKNLTTYISEKQLPYWVQCISCSHWRSLTNEVELTPEIVKTYTCIMGNLANTLDDESEQDVNDNKRAPHIKYSCSEPNDPSVIAAVDPTVPWMSLLNYSPFLKNSPAAPFLTGYYPDGVGMSAVDTANSRQLTEFNSDENDILLPPTLYDRIKIDRSATGLHSSRDTSPQDNPSSMMMSPGGRKHVGKETKICVEGLNPYFQPFYKPHERGKALCMRPDVMELDEADEFPEFYKDQTVYLAIRNLIIALWTLNPRRIITPAYCCQHLITRSLTRARLCALVVPRILDFTVRKGLVNSGVLGLPPELSNDPAAGRKRGTLPHAYSNQKVIVIGAGPAGLAAARQLHNFGCDVICVEARDRIGGRVHDDWSLDGVCVGRGAQIINGCVNNPLAMVSHQLGLGMHVLQARCDLYDGANERPVGRRRSKNVSSAAISAECDKRMEFHFNALLDIIVEWRQAQDEDACDCSLGEKIAEAHKEWIAQSGLAFSKLEERILNFHVGNLEFACGANLDKVSAFHWDQNEIFAQFSGDHAFVPYGFGTQLESLAYGLDIKYNMPVAEIRHAESEVEVTTTNGESFKADRVLVTVPLAVLRSGSIQFKPALPEGKTKAMQRLGCGCIEKIALQFPNRFWDEKIAGANYFGYVPSGSNLKGFCTVFYDIPYPQCEKSNVLMSVISGDAAEQARSMSDEKIVEVALSILANVFPEQEIPKPVSHFVTRWKDDPYAQMAYSYVCTGGSGDDYDELAKEIDNRVFFAGEGTNRHFPQTVTGAYLSGLREAAKIAAANAG
uniref:Lysine-specific histone demethylase 1B-like n=1 Tax=Phallusia mammillata TaxID=59560 RepID=A0A6F9DGA9_9ASCI|nr:lysine-specific histone demethylase 1B-like [Phallusia mammillata]